MTSNNSNPRPFDPPPAPDVASYVLFQDNVVTLMALNKGQQLLKAGKAQESIAYFNRSLMDNPDEYGTSTAESAAKKGIKAAKALLRRRQRSSLS